MPAGRGATRYTHKKKAKVKKSELPLPLSEKVLSSFYRMTKKDVEENCWLWSGKKNRWGYGKQKIGGKEYIASRLSWYIHNGKDPKSLEVCHRCNNPSCVNPKHLYLGTHAENLRDAGIDGLMPRGSKNPGSKLTEDQVDELKRLSKSGMSSRKLSLLFPITPRSIRRIVSGARWKYHRS